MKFQKDIIFFISKNIYEKIIECVEYARPNESCGLIFGESQEKENSEEKEDYFYYYKSKHFECIKSDKKSAVAFLIEGSEEIDSMILNNTNRNQKLISIFHSHPAGAHPSGIDLNHMERYDSSKRTYLGKPQLRLLKLQIWTIMDASNYELNAFIYLNKEIIQIDLQIKD